MSEMRVGDYFIRLIVRIFAEKPPFMSSYAPSKLPNTRIDVADILRGIAIGGIVLIHFIEHLNF